MTYTALKSLLLDAQDCTSEEDFFVSCGGAYPSDNVDTVLKGMHIIYACRGGINLRDSARAVGTSMAKIGRKYDIPRRTVESWSTENPEDHREPPEYLKALVLADLLDDL